MLTLPASVASKLATQGAIVLLEDDAARVVLEPDGRLHETDRQTRAVRDIGAEEGLVYVTLALPRFPWLRALVPSRPEGALDCRSCSTPGEACIACNGTGWVLPTGAPAGIREAAPVPERDNPFAAPVAASPTAVVPEPPVSQEALQPRDSTLRTLRVVGYGIGLINLFNVGIAAIIVMVWIYAVSQVGWPGLGREYDLYTGLTIVINLLPSALSAWLCVQLIAHTRWAESGRFSRKALIGFGLGAAVPIAPLYLIGLLIGNGCALLQSSAVVVLFCVAAITIVRDPALLG